MPLALDVTDLQKSYRAPDGTITPVLDVARFTLDAGAEVALAGGSGSGKTTFLHCCAGIVQPDSGEVVVAGETLTGRSETARDRLRARYVGYVFQTFNLLQGLTALENVCVAMWIGGGVGGAARAEALLTRVGLRDRLHHRPRQLSVGQQQRVAVARALVNQPALVLADEPTGNLDRVHAGEALALIRETCREAGAALLVVSHDAEVLGQFARVERLETLNRRGAVPA